jgi:hypothetical protein
VVVEMFEVDLGLGIIRKKKSKEKRIKCELKYIKFQVGK